MVAPYLSFSGKGWTIGALRLGGRASDGSITLACWHPAKSPTWYWSLMLGRMPWPWYVASSWRDRAKIRAGQWHDYYRLPFGRCLIVSRQDYHRRRLSPRELAGLFTADPPFDTPDDFKDEFNRLSRKPE